MKALLLLGVLFLYPAAAQDLGTFGTTFPIQERSLLAVIQEKLQALQANGWLEKHQQQINKQIKKTLYRPIPVQGLKTTTKARSYLFDPSIVITSDIKDHEGRIIQTKGVINPLKTVSLTKALLFINGDDEPQVSWALTQYRDAQNKPKIILVAGSPLKLTEQHDIPFYFDQSGVITKKLGFIQVPARVTQKGLFLLVEEVLIE
jgi:conjugal transfer pilus assembly protein TraW